MNRADLKKLTQMRQSDARRLLSSRRNDAGAYYMAGYAVECALKACIAKKQGEFPFPAYIKESDLKQSYYTHSITALVKTAGLDADLRTARLADSGFDFSWTTVEQWNETMRYEVVVSRQQAEEMISAINDTTVGVIQWLKTYW